MKLDWLKLLAWGGTVCLGILFWGSVILLAACGPRDCGIGGNELAPSAGADLISLGHACLWIGGAAVVGGVILRLIAGMALGALIAEAGGVAVACGLAFTWLGEHLWLVVCACVLAGLAWAYHRRAFLLAQWRHWLGARKAPVN